MPLGTPQVSPPLGAQFLCWHQTSLGDTQRKRQGIGLPTYLLTTGEGWPKATRLKTACLLDGQNLDYHCHCPPETLIKHQETGGTVTHGLEVLHSLQWHQPSKVERALCSSSHSGLPLLHSPATWGCPGGGLRPWWPTCESTREHSATKRLWSNRDVTTRFPGRAWSEGVLYQSAQRG